MCHYIPTKQILRHHWTKRHFQFFLEIKKVIISSFIIPATTLQLHKKELWAEAQNTVLGVPQDITFPQGFLRAKNVWFVLYF